MRTLLLALAGLLVAVSATTFNVPSCDSSAAKQAEYVTATTAALAKQGYNISANGTLQFTTGGNPGSSYGIFSFDGATAPGIWTIAPQEVIVWIGCTPPQADYFSFSHVVAQKQPGFHAVYADSGDSINQMVANSTMTDNFNATTALVVSADAYSAGYAISSLVNAGIAIEAVNTLIIPSEIVGSLGNSGNADQMQMLLRVSGFKDAADGTAYTASSWPVMKYAPAKGTSPSPFATPALRTRGSGTSESNLAQSLKALAGNLTTRMQNLGLTLMGTTQMRPSNYSEGRTCLMNNTFCNSGSRDALYTQSMSTFTMPMAGHESTMFAVVGVNHVAAGKASYSSFAVNALQVEGVLSVPATTFNGSAAYFDPTLSDAAELFAYVVARNCSMLPKYCMEVTDAQLAPGLPFSVVGRAYLEPATKVGPLASELLLSQVLSFGVPSTSGRKSRS